MKYITIGELQQILAGFNPKTKVRIASDEEWNILYGALQAEKDENGNVVLFGLSGSEIDED